MNLTQEETRNILKFVKKEPRTIQEISKLIGRSWVTTDSYLKRIKDDTGLVDIKTFRKGSQAALKIVFYNHASTLLSDDLKDELFQKIRSGRSKQDFDFMDIYQFIDKAKKKASTDILGGNMLQMSKFISMAQDYIYFFSGNLSFINQKEKIGTTLSQIESALKRKVHVKIICRINLASLTNIAKLAPLIERYPDFIEVRHCHHPLRGFIIDGKFARFKQEELAAKYKGNELAKDTVVIYEIFDLEWIAWLEKVFWNLFRVSSEWDMRAGELKKIF
jgi:hypothetical protein